MTRAKPFRDPALDKKPPPAQHEWPVAWFGDVRCVRCHRALSEVEKKPWLECVTNEHVVAARVAGHVVAAIRRQR